MNSEQLAVYQTYGWSPLRDDELIELKPPQKNKPHADELQWGFAISFFKPTIIQNGFKGV